MCRIADGMVFILLGIAGVIDYKRKEIPIYLLTLMSMVILLFAICCQNINPWYRLAGAVFGGILFVVSKITKEAVGYGDSWMILLLGIHLGIFKALQVLFVASIFAAGFSLFFLWRHNWKRDSTLPFITFLSIAYIGVMFA